MKSLVLILVLIVLISCSVDRQQEKYQINDLTRVRNFDSTLANGIDTTGILQAEYNNEQIRQFKLLLNKLNQKSLKVINSDTTAYRLIIDFGWGSHWSGSPLSLTIYGNENHVGVESVEKIFNAKNHTKGNSRSTDFNHPVIQQLNYKCSKGDLNFLSEYLRDQEYWNAYSFHFNDGWRTFDSDVFYLEMRDSVDYKLLVFEQGDYWPELVIPFLRATRYNDTVLENLVNWYEKEKAPNNKHKLR